MVKHNCLKIYKPVIDSSFFSFRAVNLDMKVKVFDLGVDVWFHIFSHGQLLRMNPSKDLVRNPISSYMVIVTLESIWVMYLLMLFNDPTHDVIFNRFSACMLFEILNWIEFVKAWFVSHHISYCDVIFSVLCKIWPVLTDFIFVLEESLIVHSSH